MTIHHIDAQTLKQWLDSNETALVDVREPDEYDAAHIEGSILFPLGSIENLDVEQFAGKKLALQCQRGRRSEAACHKIAERYPNLELYNLEGGISAWIEAGYATQASE